MVASLVELSLVVGVVPNEMLLSVVAPAMVVVPAMVVLPATFKLPPMPVPPLTISAPLVVAEEAVALVMLVTPDILVVASVEVFCTVILSSVLALVPEAVMPLAKEAAPVCAEVPVTLSVPPM